MEPVAVSIGKPLVETRGNDGLGSGDFVQVEASISQFWVQEKGQERIAKTSVESERHERGESHLELPQDTATFCDRTSDSMSQNVDITEKLDVESSSSDENEPSESTYNDANGLQGFNGANPAAAADTFPESDWKLNSKKVDLMIHPVCMDEGYDPSLIGKTGNKNSVLDARISDTKICETVSPQSIVDGDDQKEDSDENNHQEGKFFYYDAPLYEETGLWIPISVPPMSESERDEWTRGFCAKGGYILEADMGWSQCIAEDKELTMWDVVVEMLLVARGKVTSLASGDIGHLSWISAHVIDQAWKEMAQTLSEATVNNAQEILESEPPKWLPDSSASSCMLCGVKFHPIMCPRHHCRFCGGIFCSDCSKGRSLLPEKFRTGDPQRVCDVCCVRLESVQPYLMDRVSRAAQFPTHDLTDLSTLRSWVNFPWGQSMEYEVYKAANTIHGYSKVGSLRPEKRIPDAILRNAKGLAILTVVKVGMMVTYNIGTGLVIARREDGSWSPPSAITSFGMGWGAQAGGEFTDFIIVLRTTDAIKAFCSDAHLSAGAGLGAALGIIGRTAEADIRAGPCGLAACYTYSCSKGAFIGCSLEGNLVTTRVRENSRFYGSQSINALDIVLGSMPPPPAASTLYRALADLYMPLERRSAYPGDAD